jgi:hypothetical protein
MSFLDWLYLAALFIFYALTGLGPGFIIGMLIGNIFAVRDEKSIMQKQYEAIGHASRHNRQWHPTHERWRKQ